MTIFQVFAIIITISALFSYINYRFIKLPGTIGLMLLSLIMSMFIIIIGYFEPSFKALALDLLNQIDFNETLMNGMLSFLLFAGALHVDLNRLTEHKWVVGGLATVGVVCATFMIGSLMYFVFGALGFEMPYIYCLLFGALISPTDPVAVMGILKTANAPKSLETKIAGESLFNDGVGVVVYIALLGIATGSSEATFSSISMLFLQEAVGGVLFGLVLGYITYRMMREVDAYTVEILLTLALVAGGYALAAAIHTSGPIAIVVAGLFIGNQGRELAMSEVTEQHLDNFWELIDEILNAVLFVLIGLELLILGLKGSFLLAGLLAIPIVLFARFVSVGGFVLLFRRRHQFSDRVITIMTWAGVRGGISIALALGIPDGPQRDVILTTTYIVVIFSILVQGLTLKRLIVR